VAESEGLIGLNKTNLQFLKLQHMLSTSNISLITSVLLALTLSYIQSEVIASNVVLAWLSLAVLVTLIRATLANAYKHAHMDDHSTAHARMARFRLGVLLAGLVWGSAGFLMFPADDPQRQLFLIFMLAGLTAGGVVAYSADLASAIGFALLALAPAIIRLFIVGDSLSVAMGTAGMLYLGFMVMAILKTNQSISDHILLRLEAAENEETARASKERYRLLLEHSPVGIFHFDNDLVITYCNDRCAKIFHGSIDQIAGLDLKALKDQPVFPVLESALSGNTGHYDGKFCAIPGGAGAWMEMTCAPSRDGKSNIEGGIAIVQDVSERKRSESLAKQLGNLLQSSFNEIYVFDADSLRFIQVSEGAQRNLGYTFSELNQLTPVDIEPSLTPEKFRKKIAPLRSGERQQLSFETIHKRKDGTTYPVETRLQLMQEQGSFFMAIAQDITERKKAERLVGETTAKYRHLVESLPVIVYEFSDKRGGLYYSPQAAHILGYSLGYLYANPFLWNQSIHPDDVKVIEKGIGEFKAGGSFDITYRIKDKHGNWHWFNDRSIDKREENGELIIIGLAEDITERKSTEEQISNLAFFDPLTNLPNRRLLTDRLHQALVSSARVCRKGAVLFLDLDNFKSLNDTLGHEVGDLLLQQVAQRLTSCVRDGDTVARLGGDEFVVVLENLSEHALEATAQTESIGEKILAALSQPYQLAKREYRSTVSIGATLLDGQMTSIEELMKQADIAMYQSKKAGRNTLHLFDPHMQTSVNDHATMEDELHKAIEFHQFQLYYQIQVDNSHQPIGAEVLIRWVHPERGLVFPLKFIPFAEEVGLIRRIGLWVLETACAQIKAWQQDALTRDLVLAVNVSAKQFRQADFVSQVQALVQHHAINPMLLKLELTESLLLEDIEDIISTMDALNKVGIQFSLDDFGTGYSSLQYLKRLPLDQLKIDKSFVRDITSDKSDKAIVKTIIAMANSMNLDVIAEGVETEEQRQFLMSEGCRHFQGYLFGKPVPIEQFEAMLKLG